MQAAPARPRKSAAAFRTIGEVADELDLPAHVLRFWETKFPAAQAAEARRRPALLPAGRHPCCCAASGSACIRTATRSAACSSCWKTARRLSWPQAGEDPDIADPFAATASDVEAEAVPAADIASEAAAEADHTAVARPDPPAPHREPDFLDPAIRAELEEIRRELLQARALLDELLRPSKAP